MRLPPFSALRALEAACRRQSFTLAAEELHVTHGAVSHQIRGLEADLGVKLFRREARRMVPTEPALKLAASVAQATRVMQKSVDEIAARESDGKVTVSLFQSFARYWLGPRMKALAEAAPGVQLEIRTDRSLANFRADGVDLAIRQGVGPWPGVASVKLFDEVVYPVCTAAYRDEHDLREPADLLRVAHLDEDFPAWNWWFEAAGLEPPQRQAASAFDDASVVLDAASAGLGVALARNFHAERELAAGRLVRLFDIEAVTQNAFHVAWLEEREPRRAVRQVIDFIVAEARREQQAKA